MPAEAPVDIKVAVEREDLSDIKPLGEAHQGEIGEITLVCLSELFESAYPTVLVVPMTGDPSLAMAA
ncbi:MAG: hypothetical protein RLZZ213_119 [Cyanobacteriota bacterium]